MVKVFQKHSIDGTANFLPSNPQQKKLQLAQAKLRRHFETKPPKTSRRVRESPAVDFGE
jgi:hypothetical protein